MEVGTIAVKDLQEADELFLCGTACEILPVAELDGRRMGPVSPGPVTSGSATRSIGRSRVLLASGLIGCIAWRPKSSGGTGVFR